jgi:outer membrane protein TolC
LQAADGFPAAAAELPPAGLQQRLFELAMNRRADLAAARLREKSAEELLRAARGDLRARVDVNFNLGYEGLVEGGNNALGGLVQNRGGSNLGAALSYQWPVGNSAAQGRLAQRAASRDQQTIRIRAVERNVGVGVEAALQGYARAAQQLHESDEAVSLYRVTLENEQTKHRLGNATLIDVLSVNDRLLNARLGNVLYRAGYLNALARLNFEAGTLIAEADSGYAVAPEQWLGLPRAEPGVRP